MAFVLLIVVLLIWIGYQYQRSGADNRSDGPARKPLQGHPLYPSAAERRERYAEERNGRLNSISPEAADWLNDYLSECESPAEEVFLRTMVTEYALLPDGGALKGAGLSLQLQVDEGAYRVDFLANEWLVVEIDGAEYHASPEQVARDKARDRYFESLGYTVLRLAAKVVFHQPERARSEVRSALAAGRKQAPIVRSQAPPAQASRPPPTNVFSAFTRGVEAVGDFAKGVNDFVDRERAIQSATSVGQKIFLEEKLSINSAIEVANSKMSLENYINENPDRRDQIESIYSQLSAALKDSGGEGSRKPQVSESIARITEPSSHPDPEINEIIKRKHSGLMEERAAYFESIRDQMRRSDGRLSTLVRATLMDLGHHATWVELTGSPGQFVRLQSGLLPPVADGRR